MKAGFIKRTGAFLVDVLILSFIFTLISIGLKNNSNSIDDELTQLLEQYQNDEITIEEYNDSFMKLNYDGQRSSIVINLLEIVLYIGYFVIFGYLNQGQTIGKKICNIKVVNKDGNKPSILNMLFRSLFIYGIFTLIYSTIFVNILNIRIFTYVYIIVNYVEALFIIISFFMILYRKDGRGLHDMIAKTFVVEEVK